VSGGNASASRRAASARWRSSSTFSSVARGETSTKIQATRTRAGVTYSFVRRVS